MYRENVLLFFFFNDTATTEIYTLSLHDALPILQTVANQFLNMEPLEHGVANSCKSGSNHGTVGTSGCKQLQISFEIWNRWNMGLQTVANQFLNMEPLEHGVAINCRSVSNHEIGRASRRARV